MSVNPFSAQGSVTADAWGTGKRNDCYWNIAKNQLGEGASAQEIAALTEQLIALNNEKAGKTGERDTMIKEEQAVFLPLEYAMDEIKENVEKAQTAYTETTEKVSQMQSEYAQTTTNVNTALTSLNSATEAQQSAQAALEKASDDDPNYASLQTAYNNAVQEFQQALADYNSALEEQATAQENLDAATEELETLSQNLADFQTELQETMDEYNSEKEEYGKELDDLQKAVDELTQEIGNVEQEVNDAKAAQQTAQEQTEAAQATMGTIITQNENGEMELDPQALKNAVNGLTGVDEEDPPTANQDDNASLGLDADDKVTDNGDGTWTVTHPDGTSETMQKGEDGKLAPKTDDKDSEGDNDQLGLKDGDNIKDNGDGSWTITRADGTTEVVQKDEKGNWVAKADKEEDDDNKKPGYDSLTKEEQELYDSMKDALSNNDKWNTDYAEVLIGEIYNGLSVKDNKSLTNLDQEQVVTKLNELNDYIERLKEYSGVADPNNEHYNEDIANMLAAAPKSMEQLYLDKINDANISTADAAKEMDAYKENVEKLGKAYKEAKETYEAVTKRTPAEELISGISNDDASFGYRFDLVQNDWAGFMSMYDGTEKTGTGLQTLLDTYNISEEMKKSFESRTDHDAVNKACNNDSTKTEQMEKLIETYNKFMDNTYDKATTLFNSHKKDAKNAREYAEKVLNSVLNNKIYNETLDVEQAIKQLQTANGWYE